MACRVTVKILTRLTLIPMHFSLTMLKAVKEGFKLYKVKRNESSSGAGSMLHAESGVDVPDYDILNNDEKINLILS